MSEASSHVPHLANAEDIQAWADRTVAARTEFPRLVRRLIDQTNDQVTMLQMRAGIGAGTPGYDGIVEANRATPFVPEGRSVWELGTGGDPASKANSDYNERTANPLGEDQGSTTFVFVTSRRWPAGQAWARTRREGDPWRDVKVLDADDIERALESAPAANFWISELLDKPVAGVQTIEDWWRAFSTYTMPALTPELVLAGRLDEAAELLRIFEQDCQATTIASASTDDVLAFVAAVLLTSPENARDNLIARTLIIRDALTLRRLDVTSGLLVLLPFEEEFRRVAQLVVNHHVIFLAYEDGTADIRLPPIDYEMFKSELEKLSGFKLEGAEVERVQRLAVAARQSLVRFQRVAARRSAPVPVWQTQLESRVVRRAWLAGSWSERRTGDQDVLSSLLAVLYDEALGELQNAANGPDPLFTVVGDSWSVSSVEGSWPYAHRRLTARDLTALEAVIQTVLGAVDPALELPVDERWKASIYGKARVHSSDLRRGLAQSLAFLGTNGSDALLPGGVTAGNWADAATTRLLDRARVDSSAQLWLSLADVLPLMAEAAPDALLTAVEDGLTGATPLLQNMFIDQGDALSVNSPHTGLLWALECIAWSHEYAGFAIRLLSRLAQIDPGGRLSNRPFNSLVNIFKAWLPQTTLSADRRLTLLDDLLQRHPDVAWRLLIELLPDPHAVGSPTYAPKYRTWKPGDELRVSREEFWSFTDFIVDRVLREVMNNIDRWAQVIEKLADLSLQQRDRVRHQLSELTENSSTALSPGGRRLAWEALDNLIRQHRTYSNTAWAIPENELSQLAEIAEQIKPADLPDQVRWLFDEHVPDLGQGRRADVVDYQELLFQERVRAARKVFASGGLEGVIGLARECKLPWVLGFALADTSLKPDEEQIVSLLDNEDLKLVDFAKGYGSRRLRLEAERGEG